MRTLLVLLMILPATAFAMPLHTIIRTPIIDVPTEASGKYLQSSVQHAQKRCHAELVKQLISSEKFPRMNSLNIVGISPLYRSILGTTYFSLSLVDANGVIYTGHMYTLTDSKPKYRKAIHPGTSSHWFVTCSPDLYTFFGLTREAIVIHKKSNASEKIFVASCASDMIYYKKNNVDERCHPLN